MPSGGSRAPARGKNYVVPLAIVLVVGQIAAFVAIKLTKDKPAKSAAVSPSLAQAAPVQGSAAPMADVTTPTPPTAPPTDPTAPPPTDPTAQAPPTDPAATPPTTDTAGGDTAITTDPAADEPEVPIDPKQAKRDAAKAKAAKDKAEKLAKDKEDKAAKAEKERRDAEDRKKEADAKKASDAERARLAAEAEKARLAAEKAKAEAAAEEARLETERIKADAAAKAAAAATQADATKAKGSSSVLVLVFGPGVSGASREAIKNVYLGKTSVWPNGTTAHPMNRPAGSGAGRKFFGGILGMSASDFRSHWSQIQLSGGGISPSTVASATTMLAKVAATKGAMGYVLESELPENTNGVTLVRLK